jgi:hypothetical protein
VCVLLLVLLLLRTESDGLPGLSLMLDCLSSKVGLRLFVKQYNGKNQENKVRRK